MTLKFGSWSRKTFKLCTLDGKPFYSKDEEQCGAEELGLHYYVREEGCHILYWIGGIYDTI